MTEDSDIASRARNAYERTNVNWYLSASADDPVLLAKLERALASLRRWDWEVFLASRVDQLTYPEIAERYGMSERAVQRRMIRAYHEVVRYMADYPVKRWRIWLFG